MEYAKTISGSEKDTCVVITDFKNKNGINIQVPIFFNMSEEFITVNDIASQYPNRQIEEYITKEILKHNLLAYHNKKLENSLRTIGLLLPVVNANISSGYNISQMIKNVNSCLGQNWSMLKHISVFFCCIKIYVAVKIVTQVLIQFVL